MTSSADFAQKLLEKEYVVVTPGEAFDAPGYHRISYATSMEQLSEGATRMRRVADALPPAKSAASRCSRTPRPRHSPVRTKRPRRPRAPAADRTTGRALSRPRSATQQTSMARGGAIGTGLFLASGLSVNVAGPAIILSYAIVAGVSLLLGRALAEMAVAHPTAGSFGVYAGIYISPFAGYAVRVSCLLMAVIATGGQLVAASICMAYWFPVVPGAGGVVPFAARLGCVTSRTVGRRARRADPRPPCSWATRHGSTGLAAHDGGEDGRQLR